MERVAGRRAKCIHGISKLLIEQRVAAIDTHVLLLCVSKVRHRHILGLRQFRLEARLRADGFGDTTTHLFFRQVVIGGVLVALDDLHADTC